MQTFESKRFCASQLKVLADETRLHVMRELMRDAQNVTQLNTALGIDQSLLSHHLAVLRRAGLVECERDGKAVLYRLAAHVRLEAGDTLNLGCCALKFERHGMASKALGGRNKSVSRL